MIGTEEIVSIYLVNGPSGCGKSYFLYDMLLKKAAADNGTSYIFVVPEQFALSTEKELVEKSAGGIMNVEVLSFTRLAYRIMEEAGDNGYPLLNDMGKSMLIRRVMQEQKNELRLYAGKEKSAGFLDEMKSVISEMSQYLVTPDMLTDYVNGRKKQDILSVKLEDISKIYQGFRNKLEGVYTTAETMFELCYKHIGSSAFLKHAVLVFDQFTGFTPCQYAFIEHLLSKISDIYICVTMDNELLKETAAGNDGFPAAESGTGIFGMSADMVNNILKLGEKNGFRTKILPFENYTYLSDEIAFIRDHIFRFPVKQYDGESKTVITAHQNRKQESYFIAARISELLREEQLRYDEIAVITGELAGYAPYFEKAFRDYGISCYIDETKDISCNPLISFINGMLSAADSDFRTGEVTEFIKSPLSGYDYKSVSAFENYLICYGYRGRRRYERPWTAVKKLRKKTDIDEINRMRADVLERLSLLPRNDGSASVHEIIVSVYNILTLYGVKESLLRFAGKLSASLTSAEYPEQSALNRTEEYVKEYEKVYDAVMGLFQQIDDLMGKENCTYKEFLDIFMTGARKTKLGVLPPNKDVVIVGDVQRTRLKGIKVLFFAGVNEGIVPLTAEKGGVLTGEEREALEAWGCKLAPGMKEKPSNEEFYIYLALSKPKERLFLSYSLTDNGGGEAKPSYIVNILSAVTGVMPAVYEKSSISDKIGFDKGLSYILDGLAKEEKPADDPLYSALLRLYREVGAPEASVIRSITDDYYTRGSLTALSPETADRLYDHILISSVSRMETYSKCAYRHFLKYGLRLEKRPDNEPDSLDYGNLFHDALKRFGMFIKRSGNDWKSLTDEICEAEALRCFDEAAEAYSEGLYRENAKNGSLTERMKKGMVSTVKAVVSQIQAGDYEPSLFEYAFHVPGRFMNLSGKIDRIDICRENGTTYLKITDYKTGGSKIDFVKLYCGLQMQLMVYMNSMLHDDRFRGAVPAAAFYQEVSDPALEDDCDVEREKIRELRPVGVMQGEAEGIVRLDRGFADSTAFGVLKAGYASEAVRARTLKDGTLKGSGSLNRIVPAEDIEAFSAYAGNKVVSLSKEIMQGRIGIRPYRYQKECACDRCEYNGVCGFDKKMKSYQYNVIHMDQEEAIDRMVKNRCRK